MKLLIAILFLASVVKAQVSNAHSIWGRPIVSTAPTDGYSLVWSAAQNKFIFAAGGVGSGSVTSIGLVGTANQITVTGGSPITTAGSWTLSFPTNLTLPGTTTGTFLGNVTGTSSLATAIAGGSSGQIPYQTGAGVTAFSSGLSYTTAGSGVLGLIGGYTAGQSGTVTGTYKINGTTSGVVTITGANAAGTWTLTLPTSGGTNGQCVTTDGTGVWGYSACGSGGGVSSVSFTGGLISVATATTTPALTVAGTSGGIPYFSGPATWASSGALTANLPVIGGGAGTAPTVGTRSGNTTAFVTTTGTQTNGDCVKIDANGNHVANGSACGTSTGTVSVVSSGALTSTALVTGGGTTTLQTPAATATLDSSGNISTPGNFSGGVGTTAGGSEVLGNATGDTAASFVEINSGDGASNTEPGYLHIRSSHATKRDLYIYPCTNASGVGCLAGSTPVADSTAAILVTAGPLGTPASGVATNLTGLPLTTGVTGLLPLANGGTNCATPYAINPQTATYQVLAADFTCSKTITVASGTFTITLVASGSQPVAGSWIKILNYGTGVVTVARSGQNINGGTTSLTIAAATGTAPTSAQVWSNGTDYFANITVSASSGSGLSGLTTNLIPKATSSTTIANSSITDDGTTVSTAEAVTALSVATGTSPPTCTVGTGGALCQNEGTAPTAAASVGQVYADSALHDLAIQANGGAAKLIQSSAPGRIASTGLTAAVSTATLCAASAGACNQPGQYRIDWNFVQGGTACAVPGPGGVTLLLTWTDHAGTHTATSVSMDDSASLLATTGTFTFRSANTTAWASGSFNIQSTGAVIQYATGYTACTTGTGTYELNATVTRLQ